MAEHCTLIRAGVIFYAKHNGKELYLSGNIIIIIILSTERSEKKCAISLILPSGCMHGRLIASQAFARRLDIPRKAYTLSIRIAGGCDLAFQRMAAFFSYFQHRGLVGQKVHIHLGFILKVGVFYFKKCYLCDRCCSQNRFFRNSIYWKREFMLTLYGMYKLSHRLHLIIPWDMLKIRNQFIQHVTLFKPILFMVRVICILYGENVTISHTIQYPLWRSKNYFTFSKLSEPTAFDIGNDDFKAITSLKILSTINLFYRRLKLEHHIQI